MYYIALRFAETNHKRIICDIHDKLYFHFRRKGLPVVSIGSSFHSAKFGESFTINCNVLANPLHSLIYWQHNTDGLIRTINKDTLGVSGVSIDDPSLTIDFVTTSDSGLYTCFAENVAGTGNSRHVSLSVDGGKLYVIS